MNRPARIFKLAWLRIAVVLALTFAAWTMPPAARASDSTKVESRKTIVVLGDSLAAGFGLDPGEAFPALLQNKIDEAGLNFTVVNPRVSVDTTARALRPS